MNITTPNSTHEKFQKVPYAVKKMTDIMKSHKNSWSFNQFIYKMEISHKSFLQFIFIANFHIEFFSTDVCCTYRTDVQSSL